MWLGHTWLGWAKTGKQIPNLLISLSFSTPFFFFLFRRKGLDNRHLSSGAERSEETTVKR